MSPNGELFTYNVEPREETAYIVQESELVLIGSTSFVLTILLAVLSLVTTAGASLATTQPRPWATWVVAALSIFSTLTVACGAWCVVEAWRKSDILGRIKKRRKPRSGPETPTGQQGPQWRHRHRV